MKLIRSSLALSAVSLAALLSSCLSSSPDSKDVDKDYRDNIEFLHRPQATADQSSRYNCAYEIFDDVRMGSVKTVARLEEILGKPTSETKDGEAIIKEYKFENSYLKKSLSAKFRCVDGKVVDSEISMPPKD